VKVTKTRLSGIALSENCLKVAVRAKPCIRAAKQRMSQPKGLRKYDFNSLK
jgi:hypothetical protein